MRTLASRETVKIDLADDFWIEVKKELTYGERRQLRAGFIKVNAQGKVETSDNSLEEYYPALIMLSVQAWNLGGDGENALPITKDVIDQMNESDVQLIMQAINTLYDEQPKK